MYTVIIDPSADLDIIEIYRNLKEWTQDLQTAEKVIDVIEGYCFGNITEHPFMYQKVDDDEAKEIKGLRRCITNPYSYKIFYTVDEEEKTINILRIIKSVRDTRNIFNI